MIFDEIIYIADFNYKLRSILKIFNILKVILVLVGPRPLVQSTFDSYPESIQNKIYNIKPGLTERLVQLFKRLIEDIISSSDIGNPT